jgi:hypothetical protein
MTETANKNLSDLVNALKGVLEGFQVLVVKTPPLTSGPSPKRSAQQDFQVVRYFTERQHQIYRLCDATQAELREIADFNDPARVERIVSAAGMHGDVRRAIDETRPEPAGPSREVVVPEDRLNDIDWLEHACAPIRQKLQDARPFDRDALLYAATATHTGPEPEQNCSGTGCADTAPCSP